MKNSPLFRVVLVTAPDMKTARRIARAALEKHLAACAHLIPGLESHYWWQGKMESAGEVLIVFKTRRARLVGLEAVVRANHPYDIPEFVVLSLQGGAQPYLDWLARETA